MDKQESIFCPGVIGEENLPHIGISITDIWPGVLPFYLDRYLEWSKGSSLSVGSPEMWFQTEVYDTKLSMC